MTRRVFISSKKETDADDSEFFQDILNFPKIDFEAKLRRMIEEAALLLERENETLANKGTD